MKILVTGGAGDIGTYVVKELKNIHKLTILDIKPSANYPNIPFLKVDLMDAEETKM